MRGLKQLGVSEAWLEPAPFLFMLLATWMCTRMRGASLSSVGFKLNRRWITEFASGSGIGLAMILVITAIIYAVGGVRFELDPLRSPSILGYGFYVFLFGALLEETQMRGFLFPRLLSGTKIWVTQLSMAALFALGHWDNPGMEDATKFWASLDLALGAIIFGLAHIRTRSLALPIGLHLGWNWTQGQILGFGVSGYDQAGWFTPLFQGLPEWVTGGSYGPEASIVAVLVDLLVLCLLWRWEGSLVDPAEREPAPTPLPS